MDHPHVVFFLLGDSSASGFYMLMFWNAPSVPSSYAMKNVMKCQNNNKMLGNHPKEKYNIQNMAKV
jgi:hypothetical protein